MKSFPAFSLSFFIAFFFSIINQWMTYTFKESGSSDMFQEVFKIKTVKHIKQNGSSMVFKSPDQ